MDLRGRPGPRLEGDLEEERAGDLEEERDSDLRPDFFLHNPSLRSPYLHDFLAGDMDLRGRPGPRLEGDLEAERAGDLEEERDSDLRPDFFLHNPSLRSPYLHAFLEGDMDLRGRPGPRLEGDLEAERAGDLDAEREADRDRDSDLRPGFFLQVPS